MADLSFYIDKKPVPPPANWQGIEFEVNFDAEERRITTDTLEWYEENAVAINNYVAAGLSGGKGIYEGLPLEIKLANETLFKGYIDLSGSAASFECDKVVAPIVEEGQIDWLNDVADSFSFAYLNEIGVWTSNDEVKIPYVVSSIPDYTQAATLLINIVMVTIEITKTVKEVANTISHASGGVTGPGAAISYIAALGVYIVSLIYALIVLLEAMVENIIQPDKYKKGARVLTLFQKGCQHLGLSFSSTILATTYRDLVLIPRKIVVKDKRLVDEFFNNKSPESYGYYDGTFGDLIRGMSEVFNAKVRIIGNVLHFEQEEYWNNQSALTLPAIEDDVYKTNASEISSNYYIAWATDMQDQNTLDNYTGTTHQVVFEPSVVTERKRVTLKGLTERRIPFAHGTRKTAKTRPEKIVENMTKIINSLISAAAGSFETLDQIGLFTLPDIFVPRLIISYRIGWLQLSNDFFDVPKLIMINASDNSMKSNSRSLLSATYLADNYHHTRYLTEVQEKVYENKEVPFCTSDYNKVKNNNYIKANGGKKAKIRTLLWNPHLEKATVTYGVKENFTNNLIKREIEDAG